VDTPVDIERINSAPIPSSGKPYSQATRLGDLVFTSGQVALDDETSTPLEGGFDVQARQVLENLRLVLLQAGASLETVLKTTCFLTDIDNAPSFNTIYREFFPENQPARSTFAVAALSPGLLVEVEAIAVRVRKA